MKRKKERKVKVGEEEEEEGKYNRGKPEFHVEERKWA